MKILYIVYHDLNYNVRSQEMLKCAELLGDEVVMLSQSKPLVETKAKIFVCAESRFGYINFLRMGKKLIKSEHPDLVLLHDNYTAPLLKYIVDKRLNIPVVYDSSELYIDIVVKKPIRRWVNKIMENDEIKYLKHALISVAANEERAKIMTEYMSLERPPIVFDNMHRIDDSVDTDACDRKYGDMIKPNGINILYAGGVSAERRTYELAEAVCSLGEKYNLIITGRNLESDGLERIRLIMEKYNTKNVHFVNMVPRSELKYLLGKVSFSVSIFAQDTLNHINCASGKLYESIFEGVPVLVSENPPFKRLCQEKKVGVSDNDFKRGIEKLTASLDEYRKNVRAYRDDICYEQRVEKLAETVSSYITQYQDGTIYLDYIDSVVRRNRLLEKKKNSDSCNQ